jgi:glycosyltransferase involved in cell wall biosynthesis
MSEQYPLVSVLMTAYNREKYIAEAIESVLASSYKNFELIIVDDHSKDKTVEIAKGYEQRDSRVHVYANEKNLGDYPNRNKAAHYAKGKYLKYVDSDDILYPHCLEVMISCMEKFPEAAFGLSSIADINKPYPYCISPREIFLESFNGYGHFYRAPGSSIIKKEIFDKTGGFSGIRQVGDLEFWMKISLHHSMVKMPVDLYWSRSHTDQESKVNSEKEKQKLQLDVTKKIFAEEIVPLNEEEKTKIISSFNNAIMKKIILKIKNL